jgi:hypothetical protein
MNLNIENIDSKIVYLNEEMAMTLNEIFKNKTIIETVTTLTNVFNDIYIHLKWSTTTNGTGLINVELVCDFKDMLGVDYIIENSLPIFEVINLIEIIYCKNGSVEYVF